MYKVAALDLDGTLLDGKKRISDKNMAAIGEYVKAGGQVVVLTGRSPGSAQRIIADIEKRADVKISYYVCFSGAYVYDNVRKKPLEERLIPANKARFLWDLAVLRGYTFWHYAMSDARNNSITTTPSLISRGFVWIGKQKMVFSKAALNEPIFKCNVIAYTPVAISVINRYLRKHHNADYAISRTSRWTIEINDAGVTKGTGLRSILAKMGVALKDVMCIGDTENDLPAFEGVGCALAPANAMPAVKRAAKRVVAGKNESAVADALRLVLAGEV